MNPSFSIASRCLAILFSLLLAVCVFLRSGRADDVETVAALLELVIDADTASARECLRTLSSKIESGEVSEEQRAELKERLSGTLSPIVEQPKHPLFFEASLLAANWGDRAAAAAVRKIAESKDAADEMRTAALQALVAVKDEAALEVAGKLLADVKENSLALRSAALASLGRSDNPHVAQVVLKNYERFEPELKPKAIELLTQRPAWSKPLIAAIGEERVPASALNVNQVARLQSSSDEELRRLVAEKWGTVRQERNPQREQVVAEMRDYLRDNLGDPRKGQTVFQKVCGQCHKIYGEGQEVGPEITGIGRSSFEQLLSNVFDPSLVIGAAYQARQVVLDDGRVLTGLLAEENDQRVVLKIQGGKVETIPRDEIEEMVTSPLSLMPEGLENQLTREEIGDLFAFLALDRPPSDPEARYIPGAPVKKRGGEK